MNEQRNELIISKPEVQKAAEAMARSALVPTKDYAGKPHDILVAMQLGYELGLSPMQSLQSIAVVNGRPSIYGDAALALVLGSGLCERFVETIEGDGDNAVAKCIVKRRGLPDETVGTFSVQDAKKAGLWGKAGPWTQYWKRMLAFRARGFTLRNAFPDVLKGIMTREEAEDITVDVVGVNPAPAMTPAGLLASRAIAAADPAPTVEPPAPEVKESFVVSARRQLEENSELQDSNGFLSWFDLHRQQFAALSGADMRDAKKMLKAHADKIGVPLSSLAPKEQPAQAQREPEQERVPGMEG